MAYNVMTGLLEGKQEIMKFLNGITEYKLNKFVALGMPVVIDQGRWLAHKDNIEDFFRMYTRKRVSKNNISHLEESTNP